MFILQIEPYVMLNPDYDNNDTSGSHQRFIGYIPDLLQELSYIIHFNYEIQPVHDASFGHRRLDGTWDGMVGQLIDGVSLCACLSSNTPITSLSDHFNYRPYVIDREPAARAWIASRRT